MKITTRSFDLRAWRERMRYSQKAAADALCLSLSGYCRAEYRCTDIPGSPTNATVARLAQLLEGYNNLPPSYRFDFETADRRTKDMLC